jgi:hypothetical protein
VLSSYTQLGVQVAPVVGDPNPTQVATILTSAGTAPTITPATSAVSGNTPTLTINGSGFDTGGTNYVTLYTKAGSVYTPLPFGVIASTNTSQGIQHITVTSSQLIVKLAGPLPLGDIYATVVTDGLSSDYQQIASVSTYGPVLTTTTTPLSQSPTVLTIEGVGFNASGLNTVTLYTGDNHETQLPASQIASVIANSATQLTVVLNTGTTLQAGMLWAAVTSRGALGDTKQIANVVASQPTVDFSSHNLSTTGTTLVIAGAYFSGTPTVTLSQFKGAISGLVTHVTVDSATQLTVTIDPTQLPVWTLPWQIPWQLYATVASSSATSSEVQVATVGSASPAPTIDRKTNGISVNATQLIITGTNFDASHGGSNTVWLSSGTVQSVAATSSTRLVVTLNPAVHPLTPGPIMATVTVNGMTSSQVQVATAGSSDPFDSTIGLYDPTASKFYLRNSNSAGDANKAFLYGPAGSNWIAIVGDWNGDGISTPGLYDRSAGKFYLRNSNSPGDATNAFLFGPGGNNWTPLAGDWTGHGVDTIGLYDPAASKFYLRNSNSSGDADKAFLYGPAGSNWIAIVGDWNGDGISTPGLYDQSGGKAYLRNANSQGDANIAFLYGPSGNTWNPIVGDWTGRGADSIGLYESSVGKFFLRNSNTTGDANIAFLYGPAGNQWTPVIGHWIAASSSANALTTTTNTTVSAETATLTHTELDTIASEAIRRWLASGVDADAAAKLEAARIEIANLTGSRLAAIEDGVIYLDSTAAGHGWFVDSTPSSDEEYTATATGVAMRANSSTAAVDHIDLLTVVERELGEIAGLDDLTDCVIHNQIGAGIRSSRLAAC